MRSGSSAPWRPLLSVASSIIRLLGSSVRMVTFLPSFTSARALDKTPSSSLYAHYTTPGMKGEVGTWREHPTARQFRGLQH